MKKILKIKWERVLLILISCSTLYCFYAFFKDVEQTKVLIISLISFTNLLILIIAYKTIKQFRQDILKFW